MTENSDLQFEHAQFEQSAPHSSCNACQTPLYSSYYEVNGHTVCEACCYRLRDAKPAGSAAGRLVRATVAGVGVSLAGALLYWAILAATGYEFGLIAIVVGFGVGKAVHWGSRGQGGWAYQTLAIGLTYFAIVSAYVPMIVTELIKKQPAQHSQTPSNEPDTASTPPAVHTQADPAPGSFVLALLALLLIASITPFAAGAQNIVGIIIIGIGMYEAWKLNRRTELVVTGPHVLATSGAVSAGQ